MITKDNLVELLDALGFGEIGNKVYRKEYDGVDCSIQVDVGRKRIAYPVSMGMRLGRMTTVDFSHNENFVVLECVDRLLTKGYRPAHMELEKKWSLGHRLSGGEDSGFADICVYKPNADGEPSEEPLFIIECKTFGREYAKELRNLREDGGQLFSYWQQERGCDYLVLYASDLQEGKVEYVTETVSCLDDPNILKLAEADGSVHLYSGAHSLRELHEVWKDTYEGRLAGDVVFRDDSRAYEPDIKPLRKRDLRDFSENDRVVNKFEEILRHNNVSDKENAFNRLIALFICKLVDEMQKGDDDVVEFQYKVGSDTFESLQDRLQRLHKEGMEVFMRERIFYVPDTYAEEIVNQYTGKKRRHLIDELRKTLRTLKFYTNNDFAFKDVHNEELFYQNGKIVVEMVQLFEGYRIIGSSDVQMLGDLFEQLLNKGFKQNEGQFFTPIPIARFIWDSLPLERLIGSEDGGEYLKVIDYACGAGHFLTQGVEAINDAVERVSGGAPKDNSWVSTKLYGIEKDYRLARVSKISLFMHGAGDANIVFGDGLENYEEKGIEPQSFDVLVANPPYSVKAFKAHLNIRNDLGLLRCISNDGSEIEVLFVERIAQLLKSSGVAAVILPSTILSNDSGPYAAAREQILQNFRVRAVAGFGSKTFGATGTNTVILFLQRFNEPPRRIDLVRDSVEAIMGGEDLRGWCDADIYRRYVERVGADARSYGLFVREQADYRSFADDAYLHEYVDAFEKLPRVVKKRRQKSFLAMSETEQDRWMNEEFYSWTKACERDKITYFALTYDQTVLVINAPSDNKGQKEFLGYDWSNRKGNEGIAITNPGGMLYCEDDRRSDGKLAALVRTAFRGDRLDVEDLTRYYKWACLADMINFERIPFNNAIRMNVAGKGPVQSRYPLVSLGSDKFQLGIGRRVLSSEVHDAGGYPVFSANVKEPFGYIDRLLIDDFSSGSVLWGIDGDWMTSYVEPGVPFYPTDHCGVLRVLDPDIDPYYVSLMLSVVGTRHGFSRSYRASVSRMEEVKIPVPPKDVQDRVVATCRSIDEEYERTRRSHADYERNHHQLFSEPEITGGGQPLGDFVHFCNGRVNGSTLSSDHYVTTDNMLKNRSGIRPYSGPVPPSAIAFGKGDILLSNIRPYLQKIWLADFDGGCSNDVLVLRTRPGNDSEFIYFQLRRGKFFEYVMQDVTGVKMPRGRKEHILGYPMLVASDDVRKRICSQAREYAVEIKRMEERLAELSGKKLECVQGLL